MLFNELNDSKTEVFSKSSIFIIVEYSVTSYPNILPALCFKFNQLHRKSTKIYKTSRRVYNFPKGLRQNCPWNPSIFFTTMVFRGLRRTENWSPIMPRVASLSDSRCIFSGLVKFEIDEKIIPPHFPSSFPSASLFRYSR